MLEYEVNRLKDQQDENNFITTKPKLVIVDSVNFELERVNSFKYEQRGISKYLHKYIESKPTETDFADSVKKEYKTIQDEIFIFGKLVFWWFSPNRDKHAVLYTYLIAGMNVMIFLYMSGVDGTLPWNTKFSNETLIKYGFYLPYLKHKPWIILTYSFVHESFLHILSNSILYLILGYTSERKYGKIRSGILSIVSIVGGSLFYGAFANKTNIIVGISANIYGLIPSLLFDIIFVFQNPETTYFPRIKNVFNITIVITGLITNIKTSQQTSITAHLGGFICGSVVNLLYCKNWTMLGLCRERLESYVMYILIVFLMLWFLIFSVYVLGYKEI